MSDDEYDSDEPQVTIAQAVQRCLKKFDRCQTKQALQYNNWYENRLAEFRLWIAGSGALAGPKASLDARLEFETSAKEFMVLQLTLLELLLDKCLVLNDLTLDTSARDAATSNVDSSLDQLTQYSLAIRRAGSSSRLRKADRTFKQHHQKELYEHLVAIVLIRPPILETFRSSLRSTSPYKIEIIPNKLDVVQQRLIHANLRRRHRFQYAQVHAERLAVNAGNRLRASDHVKDNKSKAPLPVTSTQLLNSNEDRTQNIAAAAGRHAAKQFTDTTASAVDSSAIKTLSKPAAPSQRARTEISTTASKIVYPKRPKEAKHGRSFQCPCCRQPLPSMYADDKDVTLWRRHIAEDVCPYVCILPSCAQPDTMYVSKEAWLKHITMDHQQPRFWQCILCVPSAYFYDLSMFETHVRSAHEDSILDVSSYAEACESTAPPDVLECPLCNWAETQDVAFESTALLDHIAEHVHSFALRSLPWTIDDTVQDDLLDDSERQMITDWLSKIEGLHEVTIDEYIPFDGISRPVEVFLDSDRDIVDDIQTLLDHEGRGNGIQADDLFSAQDSYIKPEGYFDDTGISSAASAQTKSSTGSSDEDLDHFSTYRNKIVMYELDVSGPHFNGWREMPDEFLGTVQQHYQSDSRYSVENHLGELQAEAERRKGTFRDLAIIIYTEWYANESDGNGETLIRDTVGGGDEASCPLWVGLLSEEFPDIDFLIILDCAQSEHDIMRFEVEQNRAPVDGEITGPNPEQLIFLIGHHPQYSRDRRSPTTPDLPQILVASIGLRTKEYGAFTPDELCDDIHTHLTDRGAQNRFCAVRYGGFGSNRDVSIYPVSGYLESEGKDKPHAEKPRRISLWVVISLRIQARKAKFRRLVQIAHESGLTMNVVKRLRELAESARFRVAMRKNQEYLQRKRDYEEMGLSVNIRIRCRNWIKSARESLAALKARESEHWLGLPPDLKYKGSTTTAASTSPLPYVTISDSNAQDEEEYEIKCICTYTDDDGNTVYCPACDTWQHIECYYHGKRVPEDHFCSDCLPRDLDSKKATDRQRRARERLEGGDRKVKRPTSTERIAVSSTRESHREQSPSPVIQPLQRRDAFLDFEGGIRGLGTWSRGSASFQEPQSPKASDTSGSDTDNLHIEQTKTKISRSSPPLATEQERSNMADSMEVQLPESKAKIYYQPEAFAFFGNTMFTRMGKPFGVRIPNAVAGLDTWWGQLPGDKKAECLGDLAFPRDKWLSKFHTIEGDLASYWHRVVSPALVRDVEFNKNIAFQSMDRVSTFQPTCYVVSKDGTASMARPVVTAVGGDKRFLTAVCVHLAKNEHVLNFGALVTFRETEISFV